MRATTGDALRVYRRGVSATLATGQATEHSYRPALQALVEGLGRDGLRAVNEPSQIDCGAPDFVVIRSGVPMGYIECKDVRTNLDRAETSEQIMRYRAGLPNLVLTDYLEFRRYADGELRETARLGRVDGQGRIIAEKDGARAVGALLDAFLGADPPTIADPRELARRMASKARLLRDGIGRILRQEGPLWTAARYVGRLSRGLDRGLVRRSVRGPAGPDRRVWPIRGALPAGRGRSTVHPSVRSICGHDAVPA